MMKLPIRIHADAAAPTRAALWKSFRKGRITWDALQAELAKHPRTRPVRYA